MPTAESSICAYASRIFTDLFPVSSDPMLKGWTFPLWGSRSIVTNYGGLLKFLAPHKSDFAAAEESIVAKAEAMLAQNIAAFELRQDHKIYVDEDLTKTYVALGKDFCQKLQKVWFTEEYKELRESPATLRSIWKSRWGEAMKN